MNQTISEIITGTVLVSMSKYTTMIEMSAKFQVWSQILNI